jgi:hypothetical protein
MFRINTNFVLQKPLSFVLIIIEIIGLYPKRAFFKTSYAFQNTNPLIP